MSLLKRDLTEAEIRQRREAARARWAGHIAAAAAGGAAGVAAGAGVNAARRALAAQRLKAGNEAAAAARAKGEARVARHAAAARRIEAQVRSDWPLPAWRRHLGRQSRLFERDARIRAQWGFTPEEKAELQAERIRLDNRQQAARLPRPIRDIGRQGGGYYVAGQRRTRRGDATVIPQRLQGSMDQRLAEGWIEPRNNAQRQPLVFPTGDDLREIRRDVRGTLADRLAEFAIRTRAKAAAAAGRAAAGGVRDAQAVLRRVPRLGRTAMAGLAAGGALAGLALSKRMPAGRTNLTAGAARWLQRRGALPWNMTIDSTSKGKLNQSVATAFRAPNQRKALRARLRAWGERSELPEAPSLNEAVDTARAATVRDALRATDDGAPRRVFLPRGMRRGPTTPIPWVRQAREIPLGQLRLFKMAGSPLHRATFGAVSRVLRGARTARVKVPGLGTVALPRTAVDHAISRRLEQGYEPAQAVKAVRRLPRLLTYGKRTWKDQNLTIEGYGHRASFKKGPKNPGGAQTLILQTVFPLFKATRADIDAAASRAEPPSSAARAAAGTYPKGHINLHGLRIAIETPKGAIRRGWTADGKEKWRCRMPAHYGYVKRSMGADGDQVDVYLGPAAHEADCPVYVIDQHRLDGAFDEHKAVLGARSKREALRIYDGGFSDGSGHRRRRGVTVMTVEEFRSKALNGALSRPLAKAAPTDPMDPDDGAFGRDPLSDDTGEFSSKPEPPRVTRPEQSLSRRLAQLFRGWLDQPRRVGDETIVAEALRGPLEEAMAAGVDAAQIPPDQGGGVVGIEGPDRVLAWSFERRNPEVQRRLEQYSLGRIRAISAESRDAIRAAVIAGAQQGLPVEQQARRIRDSIGLSPGQMDWVASYRRQLETLDPRVLQRALRDRRHDSPIARALETGTPLSAEDIDRYVDSYHRRALAYRATMIARTEALRGANTGMIETARVALLSMPNMTVEKTWIATKDERTRDAHRALDGVTVQGLETPFTWRDPETGRVEQIRWPHDDQAPAGQVVQCRCTFGLRLVPKPGHGRFVAEAA